jgi:polyribonucleotide nucleotidyltransferase
MFLFDSLLKEELPKLVIKKGTRVDGRKLDQVRQIETEVALLPCAHGSATFRRGETMALSSVTLGTAQDAQKLEPLIGEPIAKNFMIHYNFPPFATGEVKPIRGVGRREIGHGYLAETSFHNILPNKEQFPYTIRSVVDILESNGSSSMATVCATTMALLDGGIPLKEMVSGIAMGLLKDESDNVHVLTDILGMEDALGLMDFKIIGTQNGIMGIQMDVKEKTGLSRKMLSTALEQARKARIFILDEMKKVLSEPRKHLSDLAPRVFSLKIPVDKIGAIIGTGGTVIKEIIAQTKT